VLFRSVVPPDGPGPNPLLQNHILMAVHPPLLYAGYVGFTAPFAFAISALALGERESNWVRRTQRWSLVAWAFLTAGIVCGAWWSYEVLGWGGYWAWDPVENASFLPWLAGTAYLHSATVQARRGMLSAWSMALVISTFALTILGTFLTRSGVIASVHSFTQSAIGPVLLGFLLVVLVGSFGLFAWRAHLVASAPRLDSLASREGAFLLNNLLLALFCFSVLTGTLYPILVEAFTGEQLSVGRPFFDRIAIPLSIALLATMALGPLLPWRAAKASVVWARLRLPVRVALVVGAAAVLLGVRNPYVVVVLLLATTVLTTAARQLVLASASVRAQRGLPWWRAPLHAVRGDPGWWGGALSHAGVVVAALGIAASGNLADRSQLTLERGESARFGGYEVTFAGSFREEKANRDVHGARIELRRDGDLVRVAEPTLNKFPNMVQLVGTPSVWTNLRGGEDVYTSLAALEGDRATVNLFRYPFLFLLWVGGLLTAGGGLLSLAMRRRRRRLDVPVPVAEREPVLEHA
jgi:cytochrome c-type biogenesis protein CcmF